MLTYVASVLGGKGPRAVPPPVPERRLFARREALGEVAAAAWSEATGVLVSGRGGLLELDSGKITRARRAEDPEGLQEALPHLAIGPFAAVGGHPGLWVRIGELLWPLEPRERVEGLCATAEAVHAVTVDGADVRRLRCATDPRETWHAHALLPGPIHALVALPGGGVLAGGEKGVTRVDPGGGLRTWPAPGDLPVTGLAAGTEGRVLVVVEGGAVLRLDLGSGRFEPLDGADLEEPRPGTGEGGALLLGGTGRVARLGEDGGFEDLPQELDAPLRGEALRPVGVDGAGRTLAISSRVVLAGARRRWKPLVHGGLVPETIARLRRTRTGALWVVDPEGRLFHRAPAGTWTAVDLMGALRAVEGPLGADGEAALLCVTPSGDGEGGERLVRIAAPREDEQGGVLSREVRDVPLGDLTGEPVTCAGALGSSLYVGVGSSLARIRGDQVEIWGPEDGLPGTAILDLEPLFDDLWVLFAGDPAPRQLGQGALPPEPLPADGPRGEARVLQADEASGQLWVGLEDGDKGAVASLSREGLWVSQLRLPAPVRALAAEEGTMLAATEAGLVLLEGGERMRRILGRESGLGQTACDAVALVGGRVLVEAGGLHLSDVGAWKPKETAAALRV